MFAGNQGDRYVKQVVTLCSKSRAESKGVIHARQCLASSPALLCSPGTQAQEMVQSTLIQKFPTLINPIKIISPSHGPRSVSQMILTSVKLTEC